MQKETRLNIRITPTQKESFDNWCRENGTTPSDEIRRYIVKLTKTTKGVLKNGNRLARKNLKKD